MAERSHNRLETDACSPSLGEDRGEVAVPSLPPKQGAGEKGEPLVLFFTGWGMDEQVRPFGLTDPGLRIIHSYHLQTPQRLWDQHIGPFLHSDHAGVEVIAWSWGVMMAEKLLAGLDLSIRTAVAINGTPRAVDDRYGIPRRVAALTLRSMNGQARETFYERMCGDPPTLERFHTMRPRRDMEDVTQELRFLIETGGVGSPALPWRRAVVGRKDLIIAPSNQLNYWNEFGTGTDVIQTSMGHLSFSSAHLPPMHT